MDVTQLSDSELRHKLLARGVSVGPIQFSTRKVYEKKLLRMMGGSSNGGSPNVRNARQEASFVSSPSSMSSPVTSSMTSPVTSSMTSPVTSPSADPVATLSSPVPAHIELNGTSNGTSSLLARQTTPINQPLAQSMDAGESSGSEYDGEESCRFLNEAELSAMSARLVMNHNGVVAPSPSSSLSLKTILVSILLVIGAVYAFFLVDNFAKEQQTREKTDPL